MDCLKTACININQIGNLPLTDGGSKLSPSPTPIYNPSSERKKLQFYKYLCPQTCPLQTVVGKSRLAVKSNKKSPNQVTGLGNRGCLKVLNDTKLVLNEHDP